MSRGVLDSNFSLKHQEMLRLVADESLSTHTLFQQLILKVSFCIHTTLETQVDSVPPLQMDELENPPGQRYLITKQPRRSNPPLP